MTMELRYKSCFYSVLTLRVLPARGLLMYLGSVYLLLLVDTSQDIEHTV